MRSSPAGRRWSRCERRLEVDPHLHRREAGTGRPFVGNVVERAEIEYLARRRAYDGGTVVRVLLCPSRHFHRDLCTERPGAFRAAPAAVRRHPRPFPTVRRPALSGPVPRRLRARPRAHLWVALSRNATVIRRPLPPCRTRQPASGPSRPVFRQGSSTIAAIGSRTSPKRRRAIAASPPTAWTCSAMPTTSRSSSRCGTIRTGLLPTLPSGLSLERVDPRGGASGQVIQRAHRDPPVQRRLEPALHLGLKQRSVALTGGPRPRQLPRDRSAQGRTVVPLHQLPGIGRLGGADGLLTA